MYISKWAVVLSVFWLLLSGYLQPLLLGFGVASTIIVLIVIQRMNAVDSEPGEMKFGLPMLRYISWLLGQIVSSSIHVTKLVWGSSDKLTPSLAKLPVDKISNENRVLYANSITLTPGTLSVDLDDKEVTVHALQQASIDELKQGAMEQKVIQIKGGK